MKITAHSKLPNHNSQKKIVMSHFAGRNKKMTLNTLLSDFLKMASIICHRCGDSHGKTFHDTNMSADSV